MAAFMDVCEDDCADVSWRFIEVQVTVAAVPWAALTIIGLLATLIIKHLDKHTWSQKLLIFEHGVSSTGIGASILLLITHMLQCLFFAMRANQRRVNAAYHSVELVLSILCLVDVIFRWVFVMFQGVGALLSYSFGDLICDCCVMTPAIAIMAPADHRHTWFSFGFLASYRIYSMLRKGLLVDDIRSTWIVRAIYHVFTFVMLVFTGSSTIMLCEHLSDEEDANKGADEWDPLGSLLFVFMTLSTVGGGDLDPRTTLGRVLAIFIICWACIYVYTPLFSLTLKLVVHQGIGRGGYLPSIESSWGHAVVCGTAQPFMIIDFLHEVFHVNHYEDSSAFYKAAPNVIIFKTDEDHLEALHQLLHRRECLDFRNRVHLILGDPVDEHPQHRELIQASRVAFVLPDLQAADPGLDDAANLVRAFALNTLAQETICILHSSSTHQPQVHGDEGDGGLRIVTVDDFKMSLMAKACVAQGVASCLCNLWRTAGIAHGVTEGWEKQYLEGLGHEIYEVTLSERYDEEPFGVVAIDILSRASEGDVYLLGIGRMVWDDEIEAPFKDYHIHPGAEFRVTVDVGVTTGLFLAQDVASIKQAPNGSRLYDDGSHRRTRQTLRAQASNGDLDSILSQDVVSGGSAYSPAPSVINFSPSTSEISRRDHDGQIKAAPYTAIRSTGALARSVSARSVSARAFSGGHAGTAMTTATSAAPGASAGQSAATSLPKQYYNRTMRDLQRSMLVHGVDLGEVADICVAVEFKDLESDSLEGLLRSSDLTLNPQAAKGDVQEENPYSNKTFGPPDREHDWDTEEGRQQALEYFHGLHGRVLYEAVTRPIPPPPGILEAGDHVLICVAMGRPAHKRGIIGEFGPELCLEHFLHGLQDMAIDGSPQPHVVVLAEALPLDWHTAVEAGNVYFVRGSPLQLADLEAVKFQQARAIAIIRGGNSGRERNSGTDAHVVLATTLIEQSLPAHSKVPVVTQLAHDTSVSFLPIGGRGCATDSSSRLAPRTQPPRQVEESLVNFKLVLNSLKGSATVSGSAPEQAAAEHKDAVIEDYAELWGARPLQHPRFMQGQIVFSSLMMQLAGKSLHNPDNVRIVHALLDTPILVVQIPEAFVRRSIMDLFVWLLRERNLLGIAIYRNSHADPYWKKDEEVVEYTFTGPKACDEIAFKSDKVICLVPSDKVH